MELSEKFKSYLINEFKHINPTKAASDYRNDVLKQLLNTAETYKINGVTDEDRLYDLCISSLGDFNKKLSDFDRPYRKQSHRPYIITILVFYIISVAAYLGISFATRAWNMTWLTFIYATAIVLIFLGAAIIKKGLESKRSAPVRLSVYMIIAAIFVATFLSCLMLVKNYNHSWTLMLYMVIAMLGADTAVCVLMRHKMTWLVAMFFIQSLTTLLYVGLAVSGIISWSPFWIMPVAGAIINAIFGAIRLSIRTKNSFSDKATKIMETDEKYYTDWN
ncbi:MAG: hypothetical protein EOM76_06625 [Sphingobacteriia bacterium]|nr:hypothetical protein [Sphingobacteriia bacterium]